VVRACAVGCEVLGIVGILYTQQRGPERTQKKVAAAASPWSERSPPPMVVPGGEDMVDGGQKGNHQRAFICGACTGTAHVGVSVVSLSDSLFKTD